MNQVTEDEHISEYVGVCYVSFFFFFGGGGWLKHHHDGVTVDGNSDLFFSEVKGGHIANQVCWMFSYLLLVFLNLFLMRNIPSIYSNIACPDCVKALCDPPKPAEVYEGFFIEGAADR